MFTPLSEPNPSANLVLSVSALNRLARNAIEQGLPLTWVSGEISNLTRAASGHIYFSLKDEAAQVRCVMFRNRAQLLPFSLANGMQVEVRALATLYEARGDFQLTIETLRRAGVGMLFEAFTRLRDKLAREGLFEPARRRVLPQAPARIGVITSLAAAALRDVLVTLKRRAPHVGVVIYPVPVQGEGAGQKIAGRILEASARRECDVLILTRGGGSIEDLWAFNEECVARAIAACDIPLVAGIGHETDVTIADFVADVRAATPTAAAEIVSAGHLSLAQSLARQAEALTRAIRRRLESGMQRTDSLASRLQHPRAKIELSRLRVASLQSRLGHAAGRLVDARAAELNKLALRARGARPKPAHLASALANQKSRLAQAMRVAINAQHARVTSLATNLAHLDPAAILGRGFSIVRDGCGNIITTSAALTENQRVSIQFGEGSAQAHITDID